MPLLLPVSIFTREERIFYKSAIKLMSHRWNCLHFRYSKSNSLLFFENHLKNVESVLQSCYTFTQFFLSGRPPQKKLVPSKKRKMMSHFSRKNDEKCQIQAKSPKHSGGKKSLLITFWQQQIHKLLVGTKRLFSHHARVCSIFVKQTWDRWKKLEGKW